MYLNFDELYKKTEAKPVSLANILTYDGDAMILEGIRELSARRDHCVQTYRNFADVESHLTSFEKYLTLLHRFLKKAKESCWPINTPTSKDSFEWFAPLSPHHNVSCLPSFSHDHMMVLHYYALALQYQANQIVSNQECCHATAATLYRRVAGIYSHINSVLLPQTNTETYSSLPMEITPLGLDLLETIALAQAQGVAADKAESKRASCSTILAVNKGAVDLFEEAATKCRKITSSSCEVNEKTRKYIAMSSEMHSVKALRAYAEQYREKGELGKATACLKDAITKVEMCRLAISTDPQSDSWNIPFQLELSTLSSMYQVYDKERTSVYMQGIFQGQSILPRDCGRVLVSCIEYKAGDDDDDIIVKNTYFM